MKPKHLSIQGFRSFSKKQVIDFDSIPNGLVLITGRNEAEPELEGNGSGKSSLFEAISFLLAGKTSTNLKANDIINWDKKEKCKIELSYEEDGKINTIIRTQSPNSLLFNGIKVSQEELEKATKLNFKSFIYSIFISQFGDKFIDLSPADKMVVFTEIMDELLDKWTNFSDLAKIKRDIEEKNILNLEKEHIDLLAQLKSLDIKSIEDSMHKWIKNHEESVKDLEDELKLYDADDSLFLKQKEEIEEKISDLKNVLDEKEKSIEDIVDEIKEVETIKEELYERRQEHKLKLNSVQTEIEVIERQETTLLKTSKEAVCSKCKQKINKEHLEKEVEELGKQKDSFSVQVEDFFVKIKKIESRIDSIDEDVKDLTQNKKSVETDKNSVKESIVSLEKELLLKEKDLIESKKKVEYLLKKIEEVRVEENPFEKILEEKSNKLLSIKSKLTSLEENIENVKNKFEIYKYLVKGFKDIRLMLTSEALSEFEVSINNNIQKLGLGDGWNIKLDIMEETKSGTIKKGFTVLVESPFNKESVPFECWSGGEGQRLRLAVSLGLSDFIKNRRGINWNWLILDEPSQFLSETGIVQMINILKDKALNDNMKIFLIDHRKLPVFGDFDSVIEVVKTVEGSILKS